MPDTTKPIEVTFHDRVTTYIVTTQVNPAEINEQNWANRAYGMGIEVTYQGNSVFVPPEYMICVGDPGGVPSISVEGSQIHRLEGAEWRPLGLRFSA